MPDATFKDYSELAGAVIRGKYPILPRPEWGQDAAYIAFVLDGFVKDLRELQADELALRAEVAEYRHALEHVAFNHPGQCLDCQRLRQRLGWGGERGLRGNGARFHASRLTVGYLR